MNLLPSDCAATVLPFKGVHPEIHPSVFLAHGAVILGDVVLGKDSSVWFNAVIRGDVHWIRIGNRTNVQDLAMLHVTHKKNPLTIGDNVTIGHSAVLHGCTIEDNVLIGMNATVMDRAVIKHHTLVAAGALVLENFDPPPNVLIAGVPAKVVRELRDEECRMIEQSAQNYVNYVAEYRNGNT
ncbi:MAG: gamma carbonic anhydrase family protein [Candidatus Kapabacteria bacterium]|nr:gamma carbonic anhydrase family protein [Candidatus Kapabacteria bacterium]